VNRLLAVSAVALCLSSSLASCSDNEGSCERIVEACHEKDTGSGEPHECHEFAEAEGRSDDECADREDDCLAACE
jgi:hypothetical protein